MARRRFFVEEVRSQLAALTGEQAEHAARVLRVEAGQKYEISDNEHVFLAEVTSARKNQVVFQVIEEIPAALPPLRLNLFIALIKFDRLELVIEKATELGVERIVPVLARRSEKGLEKAAGKRLQRWRKIALEASQQSRRARLPDVAEPLKFRDAISSAGGHRLLLDEGDAPALLASLSGSPARETAALLIGPEGGWTDDEREQAVAAGWTPVSLGPQILRAETAAIAATAVLMNATMRTG